MSKSNGIYTGENLDRIAFPLGGIGAGTICIEGTGALSHFSLRHRPEVFSQPAVFAAVSVKGRSGAARVVEGPVPSWKLYGQPGTAEGAVGRTYGLPRFDEASFEARFPFAIIRLSDRELPLRAEITAWSPFEPGDADNASLPVAALEYRFTNTGREPLHAVFSFHARNFMAVGPQNFGTRPVAGGFLLWNTGTGEKPWEEGGFQITTTSPAAKVNCAWFRGGHFDSLTMVWKDVCRAACDDRPPVAAGDPSPGASLFVPLAIGPGESRQVVLQCAWYVGDSHIRFGEAVDALQKDECGTGKPSYRPWYAGRFADVEAVGDYWRREYDRLRDASQRFSDCLYDSTLPHEVVEAVAANLSILKSPTVLRQADGRLWGWEGCKDDFGCCYGSCTHVWNYAQAICHLFPDLERTMRETEFDVNQDETGHQAFRVPLPIRLPRHEFHSAADGQLGGIMKVYRDWRICGDDGWMQRLWPRVRRGLDYCIETWDPQHRGMLEEPHHNTYDIEFWGPDGMCTSIYLGALSAAIQMGRHLREEVATYEDLLKRGIQAAERELFNGEYFQQIVRWEGFRAGSPVELKTFSGRYSAEAVELLRKEGPKYQYGSGCLSDGVIGEWLAAVCGISPVLDHVTVASHLRSVHRYNFREDLSRHANPQRPSYACGHEGGLLLCTWPRSGEPSLPFIYSNEVWTGIEYQVASHLMMLGMVEEGIEIVRACRCRYDGRVRNPFDEYECGHWYARAMASYSLLQGLSGARYDAVDKVLYLHPAIRGDFRCFFAAGGAYGTVGVRKGEPFLDLRQGALDIRRIDYRA